jgi:hypothetical protein
MKGRKVIVDYVVAGTDSGKICIIEYNPVKNAFEQVHVSSILSHLIV